MVVWLVVGCLVWLALAVIAGVFLAASGTLDDPPEPYDWSAEE